MSRTPQPLARRVWEFTLIVVLLPVVLPLIILFVSFWLLHRVTLYLLVWGLWLPKGKNVLFVYSDSPIWKEYMTQQVLPLVHERAVVLNWSDRSRWRKWSLAVSVLRSFGGHREFNPMVILFRPLRTAQVFRFWAAFKAWKHGDTHSVDHLQNDLILHL
jgi:hypothetical protein